MHWLGLAVFTLASARSVGAAPERADASVHVPPTSVFLSGEAPPGTLRVVAAISGPLVAEVGFTWLDDACGLWLPAGTGRIRDLPSFYQVSASCPSCNGLAHCEHRLDIEALDRLLAPFDIALGKGGLRRLQRSAAHGTVPRESDPLLDEIWKRGRASGAYRVRENAIRINSQSIYYHLLELPDLAPEGTYRVETAFLAADRVIDIVPGEFVLRRRGPAAWLARRAGKDGWLYGTGVVLLATLAGWFLAGRTRRGA